MGGRRPALGAIPLPVLQVCVCVCVCKFSSFWSAFILMSAYFTFGRNAFWMNGLPSRNHTFVKENLQRDASGTNKERERERDLKKSWSGRKRSDICHEHEKLSQAKLGLTVASTAINSASAWSDSLGKSFRVINTVNLRDQTNLPYCWN